jgi:hypothetical protein
VESAPQVHTAETLPEKNLHEEYMKISRKVAGSIPDKAIGFLNNASGRIMILGSTQPQTEMSMRNLLERPVHQADNFSAICEPVM